MTLVISLSKMELNFKEIFLRLIKPFNLIIGDRDLEIAYKVFNNLKRKYDEIIDILKDDYNITIIFKRNVKLQRRKEILLYAVSELRKAYSSELGPVADRMIKFALTDLFINYKLPLKIIT